MTNIQIILGSTRPARVSEKVGQWVYDIVKTEPDAHVEIVDLRDYELPFFEDDISPGMSQGKHFNPTAAKFAEKIASADGYIIIAPEYNHSFPAVLKNALDYVYNEWNNKPVGFISYGGSAGGARSVEQLRLVAVELQMAPIRNAVVIPAYWEKMSQTGELQFDQYKPQVTGLFQQLSKWADALKALRK